MWPWEDIRKAINDSDGQFTAFLAKLPRPEIERLIYDDRHQRNVYGRFDGTSGDRAREIYDDIRRRAVNGQY
jgi:hypothetical protein